MSKEDKTKEIIEDVAKSSLEVGASVVLENLPALGAEVTKIIGNDAISTVVQALTGGVLGAVAPAFLGIRLSYQQKRLERNLLKMIDTIQQKQEIIEQRLNKLDPDVSNKFIEGSYRDILLDNIISENQEEKIRDNINGFINLMAVENPNDDIVFTFFNTLSQMNQLDIRVLNLYRPIWECKSNNRENFLNVMKDEDIDDLQYNFIRQKLCRLGMLDSKNEEIRNHNIDELGNTLTEFIKQTYSKKPKIVKPPKIKKLNTSESYSITRLGRQYLDFIDEPR